MPFNNSGNGIQNEFDFVHRINNKKIKELNIMFQNFIYDLYDGKIDYNEKLFCWKNPNPYKTDIYIRKSSSNTSKKISIKKGIKNSVHVEPISEFISFLIKNKVPRDIVIKYLTFHYADGTTNGTGKNKISASEYKINHQNEIDEINTYLCNKKIITNAITRFVINGNNSKEYIDAILYGVYNDFIWIKRKDIYNIILCKRLDYSTAIHFGPLFCQPLDRCLNNNILYSKKRYLVQIKWYNLCDNIIENMNSKVINSHKNVFPAD